MMKIYSSTAVSPQRSTYLNKLKRYHIIVTIVRFLILTGFIAAWEISTRTGVVNPFIFSSPSRILSTFISMAKDGSIFMHIWTTLFETFLSFFLIIAVGLGMAVLLWLWRGLSDCLEPYLIVLNSLPKSALAPMIIVWLGNNMKAIIITAISVAIFGMIINIYTVSLRLTRKRLLLLKRLAELNAIFSQSSFCPALRKLS